jgi:uncharacterized metal-binding protein YceD (DUF177 family)
MKKVMEGAAAWSYRVTRDEVPEDGLHVAIEADEHVRAALRETGHLVDLPEVKARFELLREGGGKVHVVGQVTAKVVQRCVVTLEEIEQNIHDPVDAIFAPAENLDAKRPNLPEEDIDLTQADPPEPMIDGVVDLGALAAEHLLLAIEPYPRKPGMVFEPKIVGSEETANPFAALAALKTRSEGGN